MKTVIIAVMGVAAFGVLAGVESWSVPAFSAERRLADTYPADGEKGGAVEFVVTLGEYTGGSFVLRPGSKSITRSPTAVRAI